ncbi:uncharacterized protein LOC121398174 [Xenopus laevis]|uniref:Uncharacterized protein n=2 Tax=Xenopus laevis TaxID=8355 RepID=A0A974BYU9_XENLA|nr:uncharacterized protein LOC121398174 [Xenopus laevis]OCT63337.1 hypothetical protein XELAEV_18044435mg [Xenopus laevis]
MNYLEDTSPCPLSEEESKLAYGAKKRALDIFYDLEKRDSVLVECVNSIGWFPSLTPHLVHSLRTELERVTFVKVDHPFYAICYIYPRSHERTIYLGPRFWKQGEILGADSRPGLLIKKAAQFLFHKTLGAVPVGQGTAVQGQRHEPRLISANQIHSESEMVLNHQDRETAQDSVCEDSYSRPSLLSNASKGSLLSEEEWNLAEEAKQRTLRILFDALEKKDSLLVENPEDFVGIQRLKNCPLIPQHLVQDLITRLLKVTFMKGKNVLCETFYLVPDSDEIIIYLSPDFWHQKEMLDSGSRPGTLILELSQVLGYKRYLERITEDREGDVPPMVPLSASNICSAFETWMSHKGLYSGFYSCCGEESRDSVCALSDLSVLLNDIIPPPVIPK